MSLSKPMAQIPHKYFKCDVSENLVLHYLCHSLCLQFLGDSILHNINKALNWKLASCRISLRTQHSEECSVVGLSFLVLCNTYTVSSQIPEREPTSVFQSAYFSCLLHKKQCFCLHLSKAPHHGHWKVLREVCIINSIQYLSFALK